MADTLDTVKNATREGSRAKMPSKSASQARLMAAAAHTKGGYGGVPQSVGKEYNQADSGSAQLRSAMKENMRKKAPPKQYK